jgi:hypothetical protein
MRFLFSKSLPPNPISCTEIEGIIKAMPVMRHSLFDVTGSPLDFSGGVHRRGPGGECMGAWLCHFGLFSFVPPNRGMSPSFRRQGVIAFIFPPLLPVRAGGSPPENPIKRRNFLKNPARSATFNSFLPERCGLRCGLNEVSRRVSRAR